MFVKNGFGDISSRTIGTFERTFSGMREFMSFHLHVSEVSFTALFARVFVAFFMYAAMGKMFISFVSLINQSN